MNLSTRINVINAPYIYLKREAEVGTKLNIVRDLYKIGKCVRFLFTVCTYTYANNTTPSNFKSISTKVCKSSIFLGIRAWVRIRFLCKLTTYWAIITVFPQFSSLRNLTPIRLFFRILTWPAAPLRPGGPPLFGPFFQELSAFCKKKCSFAFIIWNLL